MKHPRALLSTLAALTTAIVGISVVAAAVPQPVTRSAREQTPSQVVVPTTVFSASPAVVPPTVFSASPALVPPTARSPRQDARVGARGTRSDDQFFEISSTGTNDVPEAALRAYRHAETAMRLADPGCDISWTLLAAIGRVESNHGRFAGAQLGSDGVSRPEIRGPRLDGAGAFAAISDSDNGTLDRDAVWDRAVGQMQFLPQTWRSVARDGDGDGQKNPDDIDDAALGSAVYLCGAGGSLADAAGMSRAAFRYNHSDYYVGLVLDYEAGYQTGVFPLPSPPPEEGTRTTRLTPTTQVLRTTPRTPGSTTGSSTALGAVNRPQAPATTTVRQQVGKPRSSTTPPPSPVVRSTPTALAKPSPSPKPGPQTSVQTSPKPSPTPTLVPSPSPTHEPSPTTSPIAKPSPTPSPKPTPKATPKPSPTPSPTPTPTSPGPERVELEGTWTVDESAYYLDDVELSLGLPADLALRAGADFDGDGVVESNAEEFGGLDGKHVVLLADRQSSGLLVLVSVTTKAADADG